MNEGRMAANDLPMVYRLPSSGATILRPRASCPPAYLI